MYSKCKSSILQVWLLTPIAMEDQARQLLRSGRYGAFKALAKEGAALGTPWAQIAFAEAGFKFLHGQIWHLLISF